MFRRFHTQIVFVQTEFQDSPEGRFFLSLVGAVAELEKASERRLAPLPRGRPRKQKDEKDATKDAEAVTTNLLCP